MLVDEIVRDHERPVILHIRRRHLQQARAAIRKLCSAHPGGCQQEARNKNQSLQYVISRFQFTFRLLLSSGTAHTGS